MPISEENERIVLEIIKRKMRGVAGLGVRILHAMKERFGPEAREVVREMARAHMVTPRTDAGGSEAGDREFCARLDRGWGGHRRELVMDKPDRIGNESTRCIWADIYLELGKPGQ